METQNAVDVINETLPKKSSSEPNENSQKVSENSEISSEGISSQLNNVESNNGLKENSEMKSKEITVHEKSVDLNCEDVQNKTVSNVPEIEQENSKQTTRFSIRQQKSRENSPTKISPPLNKIKNQNKSIPKRKTIARKRKLNENLTEDMNDVIEKLKATKIRNKGNIKKLKRSKSSETVDEKREKPETEIVKPKKNTRITKNTMLPRVKKLNKSKKLMHIKTGKKKLLKVTKTEHDASKRRGRPTKRKPDATSVASKRKKPNETTEEIDKVEEQLNVLFFGREESTTIELTDEHFQKVDPLTLTSSPKPKRTYLGPKSKAKNTTPNKITQKKPMAPKKEEEEDTKPTTRRVYPAKRKRATSDIFNSVKNDAQLMLNHAEDIKNDSGDEMENTITLDDDSDAESREEWMPEDYAEYKYRFSMKKLKKTKEFTCKICLKVFQSYYKMKQHQKVHVDKRDPYTCQQCEETFTSVDELTAHLRAHKGKHPYQCKKCEKGFWSKSELEEHTPIHILKKTKQKEKRFRCDVCAKEFSKLCDMERHMRVHTGEKPCVCNICNKRFQQSHNLSKHLLTHLQVRPYHCEICNKKFGRNDVLNRHLLVHSVEKPFMCEYCPKGFIRQQQYTHHMNKVHSGEPAPTKDPQPPRTTETDANV